MTDPVLGLILHHLDPPSGTRLWHGGASVIGALRGVSAAEAAWRPAPGRHSIWALTLHVAYWKYVVHRKIVGGPKGAFPRTPSNFPDVPKPVTEEAWRDDRTLLRETHRTLVDAVRGLDPRQLDDVPSGKGSYSYRDLTMGIVLHDTHHAGQVVMLKRLYATRS